MPQRWLCEQRRACDTDSRAESALEDYRVLHGEPSKQWIRLYRTVLLPCTSWLNPSKSLPDSLRVRDRDLRSFHKLCHASHSHLPSPSAALVLAASPAAALLHQCLVQLRNLDHEAPNRTA